MKIIRIIIFWSVEFYIINFEQFASLFQFTYALGTVSLQKFHYFHENSLFTRNVLTIIEITEI